MAKTISEERMTIILTLTREGGSGPVGVEARVDYLVTSDDLSANRPFVPTLSATRITNAKTMGNDFLNQIKAAENIV